MPHAHLLTKIFPTAWGYVGLAATEHGLVRIALPRKSKKQVERGLRGVLRGWPNADVETPSVARVFEILDEAERQVGDYLAGRRRTFDLPLAVPKATDFMRSVWRACSEIPYGKTRSYQWIAKRIGRPKASRAVGAALGANPLPLAVPCHRVMRSDGSLGGFGGGLPLKQRLLALESQK